MTYAQLFGVFWLVTEFVRTEQQQQSLMCAFCLGAYVPLVGVLGNLAAGVHTKNAFRYSFSTFNANDLALMLVLGMPMAWHITLKSTLPIRVAAMVYFALAPVGALLTGSRGAAIAGVVGLAIVPLTVRFRPGLVYLGLPALCVATLGVGKAVLPAETWGRILTIQDEVSGTGTLTGRTAIWSAGLQAFSDRPLLGYGAGTFDTVVEPLLGRGHAAHNAMVAILVEQGIVGLSIFSLLLAVCSGTIARLPIAERKLWAVLMLSWLVGVMSLSWQYRKVTWLLFAMLAAERALARAPALPLNTRMQDRPDQQAADLIRRPRDAMSASYARSSG